MSDLRVLRRIRSYERKADRISNPGSEEFLTFPIQGDLPPGVTDEVPLSTFLNSPSLNKLKKQSEMVKVAKRSFVGKAYRRLFLVGAKKTAPEGASWSQKHLWSKFKNPAVMGAAILGSMYGGYKIGDSEFKIKQQEKDLYSQLQNNLNQAVPSIKGPYV